MGSIIELPAKNHFGTCPKCKKSDGHLNIGRHHWFLCRKHRVKWKAGYDIFPDWKKEDPSVWRCNERLLDLLMEIEPFQHLSFSVDEDAFFAAAGAHYPPSEQTAGTALFLVSSNAACP
jgi:hypothetical protein